MDEHAEEPSEQQWQLFEHEVTNFLEKLDPNTTVEHNAHVLGI